MDEGEKPFPIEFIVILLLIAAANDIAQVFFLLLDFTGVGVAGEAIMEPADAALGVFFTGIFVWRVGWGGGTISQYIGSLLQMLPIPTRIISVGIGMWIANHPSSLVGKVATTAASLESGNVGGAMGEAEGTAGKLEGAADAEKKLGSEKTGNLSGKAESEGASATPSDQSTPGEDEAAQNNENTPESDVFKNPYENPVGTAEEEAFNPSEDAMKEGKFNADDELPNAA